MKEKIMYYICFNNCEGSFPQMDSESLNKEEVENEVKRLNANNDNPYCCYCVCSKKVYVKGR